ncbi:MAG TPA: protein kinase, partial [Thermoanaerobaculia bacterium]|nr:protein kinase [Thermoanaerobaculia bacterium]
MPLTAGARCGRFELLARIGVGGMGEVWRARDRELGRDVAVKFLGERFAGDADRLARFAQEARAASALNHPNIVTVHEIGEAEGRPFLVLELVDGVTLRALLSADAPLPARRALELGAQIAEGLARAHAAGIVHRDLKPENVMVRPDGLVKILDFGLAKLLDARVGGSASPLSEARTETGQSPSPATADGVVLGTVGYMSPEQARGREIDFRADQFALGAILYELATGERAFHRETPVQTLAAILEREPEPLAQAAPLFPPPARWIVERCLAKEPAERYAATLDLARELRAVRDHLGEIGSSGAAAVPSGASGGPRTPVGRLPRWAWMGAAAAALAGLLWASGPLREGAARLSGARSPLPAEKRVAVLPFHVASASPSDRFLADGLVEGLTARLSQLDGGADGSALSVVPAADVRAAGVASTEGARRAFGATLALTGSLQRLGEQVRLHAVLVDAVALQQLRALGPRDYRLDDLSLHDRFLADAAELLELGEGAGATPRAGATASAGAYGLYLEARGCLQSFERRESVEEAISLLQRALAADPGYALAHAALAEAYWRLYELTKRTELVPLARQTAERALAIEDLQAQVYLTLGLLSRGTGAPQEALASFARALDRDPRGAEALRERGRALADLGRREEAEASYRQALALRPTDWAAHNYLGALLVAEGRLEQAAAEFREVARLAPENPRGHTNLGVVAFKLGALDEAERTLRRSVEIRPTPLGFTNLGATLFYLGRYEEAADAFARAVEGDERNASAWLNLGRARHRAAPGS